MTPMEPDTTESRLSRLEGVVERISADISQLAETFSDVSNRTDRRINDLLDRVSTGRETNWQQLAVILSFFAVIGAVAVAWIGRVEDDVTAAETRSAAQFGHLDGTLQREMRLLDSAFQREIQQLNHTQDVRTDEIERRTGLIETWQVGHDLRVVGLNSAQTQRIRALERIVFGKPEDTALTR